MVWDMNESGVVLYCVVRCCVVWCGEVLCGLGYE